MPGACQDVARSIHTVFTRLGGKPEYVELTTRISNKKVDFHIVFQLVNGKDARVADTGLHVLVRMSGRAYDAYTGASGLPWAEYLSRLGARAPSSRRSWRRHEPGTALSRSQGATDTG